METNVNFERGRETKSLAASFTTDAFALGSKQNPTVCVQLTSSATFDAVGTLKILGKAGLAFSTGESFYDEDGKWGCPTQC